VRVDGANTHGILIERNSIFANDGLGIELVGGANNGVGPPTLSAVPPASPSGVRIVCGDALAGAEVELFRSAQADPTMQGEGETFLASGIALPPPLPPPLPGTPIGQYCIPLTGLNIGDWLTATVTAGEDTSAFSTALRVSQ
jgi:hypothetical protein